MNAFIVELKDQPGEVARVTEAISHKGIDIMGFAGASTGEVGVVVLITNDEAGTRSALAAIGCTVREAELVTVALENRPGSLAAATRKLADAGINIQAALPTGMAGNDVHVAFATSDPARARQVLGDRVMTAAMG
jgi:hypothetical protein